MPGGVPVALQPDVHALAGAGGGAGRMSALRPPRPRAVPEGPRRPAPPAQGHAGEHLALAAVTQRGQMFFFFLTDVLMEERYQEWKHQPSASTTHTHLLDVFPSVKK